MSDAVDWPYWFNKTRTSENSLTLENAESP
jgi:hypothetical protein